MEPDYKASLEKVLSDLEIVKGTMSRETWVDIDRIRSYIRAILGNSNEGEK